MTGDERREEERRGRREEGGGKGESVEAHRSDQINTNMWSYLSFGKLDNGPELRHNLVSHMDEGDLAYRGNRTGAHST